MPLKIHAPRKPGGNYRVRGTVRGVTIDQSTGTANEGLAREFCINLEADLMRRAIYGEPEQIAPKKRKPEDMSFAEAVVLYLETEERTPHTAQLIAKLLDHFGEMKCGDIDQDALDQYISKRHHPAAAPASIIRHTITPLTAILTRAGIATHFRRPKVKLTKLKHLTREEVQRLADAAPAHLAPLIIFLAHTGLRMGEALSLEWEQVNLKARHILLLQTKNGTQRGVPLNDVALAALANLAHRRGRVFRTHLGEPYQLKFTGQIKKGWKSACEKAGFVEISLRRGRDGSMRRVIHNSITPHTLRHTFISWMVQAGVPLYTAGKVAGHKSPQMTARYAHLSPDHMMDAVTSIVQNPCADRKTGDKPLKLKRG